jgi:2-succinyl-5-enolpyruvyl-6-hydroxy-3-cyclohexene-1-carboxylate synthase
VTLNAAQAIVAMLKAYEVQYVFGVPGDTSIPFYDALHEARDQITHIMARDERGASYMADVYARLSGRPGVCEAPSGAGAVYLLPGLAEANASSIPIIAFTSDIPLESEGRNVLTELNQGQLFESVTKWHTTLKRGERAPEVMRKAFRLATTGRPGPVQITLPEDVLEEPALHASFHAEPACRTYPAYRTVPDAEAVAALRAGAITEIADRPDRAARQADLVVLAAPPGATLNLLQDLHGLLRDGSRLCTDVTSVKRPIMDLADRLGLAAAFAGSHPLAGTHESGFAAATPSRLDGALVYVTPLREGELGHLRRALNTGNGDELLAWLEAARAWRRQVDA